MTTYLSLGSNIHPRHKYIDEACRLIEQQAGHILARSQDFYSAPWGYDSKSEYLNIALKVETRLLPFELLRTTQEIERQLGREIKGVYADRTIDIDIMLYINDKGEEISITSPTLTIPHPHISEREFMQQPLNEIRH